jgi:hypothetical protein
MDFKDKPSIHASKYGGAKISAATTVACWLESVFMFTLARYRISDFIDKST